MRFTVVETSPSALAGLATRRQVRVLLDGTEAGPAFELLLYLPKAPRPAAAFPGLDFAGNHSVHADPGNRLSQAWMRDGRERRSALKGGRARCRLPPVDIIAVNEQGTLFVSGEIEAWEALSERGIDTIVDMDASVDAGLPQAPNSILYVYHPILDEDLPNLAKIEALGRLVADLVSSEHRVLVHCRMGLNRSALVIATALTYLGMTGAAALLHLRECRPGALFNEAFASHVARLPARRIRVETL